ncbi:MAG: ThiF family adenylyltransferase [Dehalococcoidia bacterium]|nr:ThiF family adenylyltransferase [Dehalococcoidia bacterium]
MRYRVVLSETPATHLRTVCVVGTGGTGSMVADGLCRLLPKEQNILLIDHDRVEPHNLRRQNFFSGDVGLFKSQALAERLSRQYDRKVGYSILPFTRHLLRGSELGGRFHQQVLVNCLIVGCLDNTAARLEIMRSMDSIGNWWLDAGNGHHWGQVLLGNATDIESLAKAFDPQTQTVRALPSPSLQLPGLLVPAPAPKRDCAQEIEDDEQSPVINQAMALLVLTFVHKLLTGSLTWMGAYLDLEAGTLQTVPADPETVARVCGLDTDTLTDFACGHGAELLPRRGRRAGR